MDKINILKYKNIDINKIQINDFNIKYDNLDFYIQSPIFYNYDIINHQNKKYLELKIDRNKLKHIKFLTLFDTLELKINNQNNIKIKTQIITDIQNRKSIKVKLLDGDSSTLIYDKNKNQVNNLISSKISLLLNIEFYKIYYSITAIQILQL
tara:strand:+ start:1254 stop:1709 length:456 start_codon:yes stop_codon:yes gene_type:complete